MILLDFSICILVVLIGFNLKNLFSDFSGWDKRILNKLFIFHFLIAVAFHFYIQSYGGDAQHYWYTAKSMSFSEIMSLAESGNASGFVFLINYIPSQILDLSIFTGNMLYALFGYFGFIYLYRLCIKINNPNVDIRQLKLLGINIFPWILFLPNLHFWSSGIGKDVLIFTSIIVIIYSISNIRKNLFKVVFFLLISLAIRPHITLYLIFSFGIAFLISGNLKSYQKLFIAILVIIGFFGLLDYVIKFIQLESLELSSIEEFSTNRASNLAKANTGSAVDTSNYSLFFKMFTFLYRPLFFDVNGILAFIGSIENFILLCFTFLVLKNKPINTFKNEGALIYGMFIFFLIGTVSFSLILGNLGIMLRQKNMFIPIFIVFGLWVIYQNVTRKKESL